MQSLCDFVGSFYDQSFPNFELLKKIEEIHINKCIEKERKLFEEAQEKIANIKEIDEVFDDDFEESTPDV